VAGLEPDAAVVPRLAQEAEEPAVAAAHLDHHPARQPVPLDEVPDHRRLEAAEQGRAVQGVVVVLRVVEQPGVEGRVPPVAAAGAQVHVHVAAGRGQGRGAASPQHADMDG
jgi:hypothetical protein